MLDISLDYFLPCIRLCFCACSLLGFMFKCTSVCLFSIVDIATGCFIAILFYGGAILIVLDCLFYALKGSEESGPDLNRDGVLVLV